MKRACQPLFYTPNFRSTARIISMLLLCVCLASCLPPRVDNRGHVDAFGRADEIIPGQSTRDDVFELLGSPSITNNFGEEIWYYVAKRKEAIAFLKADITEQKVTRIVFDNTGVVKSVNGYGLNDSQNVVAAKDVTPTEGHELGFMEQILGNVGRFNGAQDRQPNLQRR